MKYTANTTYVYGTQNKGTGSGVMWSKDVTGDGKKSWLGLPPKNEVLTKCYCTGGLATAPNFNGNVDLSGWATEDGKYLNLEQYINSAEGRLASGLFGLVGAYLLFF